MTTSPSHLSRRVLASTVLTAACLLAVPALSVAQASPERVAQLLDTPMVHAGLFGLTPEGNRDGSRATTTAEEVGADLDSAAYLSPCSSMGGSETGDVPSAATEAWRLSGRVVALTPEQASFHVSWQQIRSGGREVSGPAQNIELTLKRGERTTLERLSFAAKGSCAARSAVLEVAFATRRELMPGTTTYTPAGAVAPADSAGRARIFAGSAGGVTVTRVAAPGQPVPTMLSADLWLMNSPDGNRYVIGHATSPVLPFPQAFVFQPFSVKTSTGVLSVTVQGTLEVGTSAEGEPRFFFSANRTLTFTPSTGQPRDTPPTVEGSTKTAVAVPGPDDVLSFELPPLRVPGGAILPDRLSIRVRLTPVPLREMTRP